MKVSTQNGQVLLNNEQVIDIEEELDFVPKIGDKVLVYIHNDYKLDKFVFCRKVEDEKSALIALNTIYDFINKLSDIHSDICVANAAAFIEANEIDTDGDIAWHKIGNIDHLVTIGANP